MGSEASSNSEDSGLGTVPGSVPLAKVVVLGNLLILFPPL